jgi:hypothetical protein
MVSPGNYQILAVAGSGGKDVASVSVPVLMQCARPGRGLRVDTKTGVTAGAVRQGINTRFDDYQTSQVNPDDMPPDTNIKGEHHYDQYKAGSPLRRRSHTGFRWTPRGVIPIVKQESSTRVATQ